jgi:ADP-ribose pyrophosphatase YjhB (NUDIX family)
MDARLRKHYGEVRMNRSDIKVKAYAVLRRGHEILVNEVRESDGTLKGFRVPGGHVEFSEKSIDTVKREIKEELNADITDVTLLTTMENTFVYNGKAGHEVIFVYTANFEDASFYKRDKIEAFEDNGQPFTLFWQNPDNLPPQTGIFPSGLKELL